MMDLGYSTQPPAQPSQSSQSRVAGHFIPAAMRTMRRTVPLQEASGRPGPLLRAPLWHARPSVTLRLRDAATPP